MHSQNTRTSIYLMERRQLIIQRPLIIIPNNYDSAFVRDVKNVMNNQSPNTMGVTEHEKKKDLQN